MPCGRGKPTTLLLCVLSMDTWWNFGHELKKKKNGTLRVRNSKLKKAEGDAPPVVAASLHDPRSNTCSQGPRLAIAAATLGMVCPYPPPPPGVQRMPCPTNTSVQTVFFEDIINYVLNYVPGFRIEVFKLKDRGNEGL